MGLRQSVTLASSFASTIPRLGAALAWSLGLSLGCDPTAGISDAANGALPEEKRYIDAPGELLATGPWNRVVVDVDTDTLYHVGARRLDDDTPTFHLFGTESQQDCQISPNSATLLVRKLNDAPFRLLPYLEDANDQGRGTLRFATLDCEVQDIQIEDATEPLGLAGSTSFLVPVAAGLARVDPWANEQRTLVTQLQASPFWFNSKVLVWGDGQLKSLDADLNELSSVGEGVVALVDLGDNLVIEDDNGLHLVRSDEETGALTSVDIVPGGCKLQNFPYPSSWGWFAMHAPCDNPSVSVARYDPNPYELFKIRDLGITADARLAKVDSRSSAGSDETTEALFYLTDVTEDGSGTLWLADAEEAPLLLGERATLSEAYLLETPDGFKGNALVDLESVSDRLTARWLHFKQDGSSSTFAEKRLLGSGVDVGFPINFDGVSVDIASVVDGELVVSVEKAPPFFAIASALPSYDYLARIDQFDGDAGRLSLASTMEQRWQPVGERVAPRGFQFAWFMPALFFLDDFDAETKTGTLIAYNFELGARGVVAKGVSSFDLTAYPLPGVLYAVPYGKQRGIWFAKAK